jgi:hypothetical protein
MLPRDLRISKDVLLRAIAPIRQTGCLAFAFLPSLALALLSVVIVTYMPEISPGPRDCFTPSFADSASTAVTASYELEALATQALRSRHGIRTPRSEREKRSRSHPRAPALVRGTRPIKGAPSLRPGEGVM